ncbi:unnamed protein product [marine sediment metagenome]|uniref:Uncharacterized protein n=1 Tax=marine sediment metagenome TaxID=412755 RepID=X1CDR1_9ZZZZ
METELYYLCLECGSKFKNLLQIAVCPKCLEREKKNFDNGIRSKYETVNRFLRKKKKT